MAAEMETNISTLMEIGLLINVGVGMELSMGKGRIVHLRLKFGTRGQMEVISKNGDREGDDIIIKFEMGVEMDTHVEMVM